jgi:diacylglycerol kinase family enzyme
MGKEKAFLITHPKAQHHIADVLPILKERWEVKNQVTAYAGHGVELAVDALREGYSWIISFGGDGMLNEIINGAMMVQQPCTIGTLPGGTVNQWAHEIGLSANLIEAARVLTESSEPRLVDIGFIGVQALTIAGEVHTQSETEGIVNARQHFIIVAGFGIDATTIHNRGIQAALWSTRLHS